jgi:hypothetical protein
MRHIALIGDSILDNSPYTAPEPDTTDCLQRSLGTGWSVELLARDGSTMSDLRFQFANIRKGAEIAVLSIGGNDAIAHIQVLDQPATGSAVVLDELATIVEEFGVNYRRALADLLPRVRRLIVCTIYEPPLHNPTTARLAKVPLSLINDRIIREANRVGVDVIDLRTVCTDAADFVKEIEPSGIGARKIAAAIDTVVRGDGARPPIGLFSFSQ